MNPMKNILVFLIRKITVPKRPKPMCHSVIPFIFHSIFHLMRVYQPKFDFMTKIMGCSDAPNQFSLHFFFFTRSWN